MMREQRGLPIAAHLGLLVALAFASAFVVMLAVVIWLPPRPPDVMRGDQLIDLYAQGFAEMKAGRRPSTEGAIWRVQDEAPRRDQPEADEPFGVMGASLAERLAIRPDKVRIAADMMRSDTFVFRVRDVQHQIEMHQARIERAEAIRGEAEALHEQIQRDIEEARREGRIVEQFTIRVPDPPPLPPAQFEAPEAPEPPEAPTAPMPPEPPLFAPAPPGVVLLSGFEIGAQMDDGRWLVMRQGRNWAELSWIARAALMIGVTLTVLSVLALWFARRLAQPIRNFADAVQAVGVDPQSESVSESGPRELRGAARAVNTMQARLRALIADRTKTLATVAHDMRTPLMRLRLAAENVEPAQRERMAKEIGEVEALVASFIAFARDDPAEEPRVRLDLAALLQSLVVDHEEAGRTVSYSGEERVIVTGQSLGLKRLFANVIDNALKYGGVARVTLNRTDEAVIIEVEDDGPGIAADQRENVFEPFVRLSREESGAGLGLPAARGIARAHGGEIAFVDAERGARVRVTLPL